MTEPYEARRANLSDCTTCRGDIYYFDRYGTERACKSCSARISMIPMSDEVADTARMQTVADIMHELDNESIRRHERLVKLEILIAVVVVILVLTFGLVLR